MAQHTRTQRSASVRWEGPEFRSLREEAHCDDGADTDAAAIHRPEHCTDRGRVFYVLRPNFPFV